VKSKRHLHTKDISFLKLVPFINYSFILHNSALFGIKLSIKRLFLAYTYLLLQVFPLALNKKTFKILIAIVKKRFSKIFSRRKRNIKSTDIQHEKFRFEITRNER
jgi:hypothetical protein